MRAVPHLEGILLAIDVGVEISERVGSIGTELCLAGVTDPGRDVVLTEVVAVVAVHARIGAGRSDRVCCVRKTQLGDAIF